MVCHDLDRVDGRLGLSVFFLSGQFAEPKDEAGNRGGMLSGTAEVLILFGQIEQGFEVCKPHPRPVRIQSPAHNLLTHPAGGNHGGQRLLRRQHRQRCAEPSDGFQQRMRGMAVGRHFQPEIRIGALLQVLQPV